MLDVKKRDELLEQFRETADANFKENCSDMDMVRFMKSCNDNLVRECVRKIRDNVYSALPMGIALPKDLIYQKLNGENEIEIINITVINTVNGEKKFKFKFIVSQHHIEERIKSFFVSVYSALLLDSLIEKNLEEVNWIVKSAVEKAELPFSVKVVSPLNNEGKKIAFMSDDEIHFVCDEDRIFELNDIMVLQEPGDLITEEMIQDAFEHEVQGIAGAQTPEQLLQLTGGSLICYVCNLSKLVKPITLMKKITNRNIIYDRGSKDAILYYLQGDVFALISKVDGNFDVLLSPVDVNTLRKVDVDVLEGLND